MDARYATMSSQYRDQNYADYSSPDAKVRSGDRDPDGKVHYRWMKVPADPKTGSICPVCRMAVSLAGGLCDCNSF